MFLKLIVAIFLISLNVQAYSQLYKRSQLDSLVDVLGKQKGIEKVRILLNISETYMLYNLDTAQLFSNQATQESQKIKYEWGIQKSQFIRAKIIYENTHIDKVLPLVLKSQNWFAKHNFKDDELECSIFYSNLINQDKGDPFVKNIDDQNLIEAVKSENYVLLGNAWINIQDHKPHLLDNSKTTHQWSIDSSRKYYSLASDSVGLLKSELQEYNSKPGRPEVFKKIRDWMNYGLYLENTTVKLLCSNFMAINHVVTSQYDSTDYYLDRSTKFINSIGSKRSMIKVLKIRGYSYTRQQRLKESLETYQIAYDYAIELGDREEGINILRQIAGMYSRLGDYEKAIKLLIRLINIAEELDNQYLFNSGRRALGYIYVQIEELEKAEVIYLETLEWADTALSGSVKSNLCRTTNTQLGDIYRKQKKYDKALNYFKIDTSVRSVLTKRIIEANFGLLQTYTDMGDVEKMVEKYESIVNSFPKNELEKHANFLFFKGKNLVTQANYKEGINALKEYLTSSDKIKVHENRVVSYQYLYKANKELGNYKDALVYFETYKDLKDSLKLGQATENVKRIKSDYELSLKESEIKRLEQQQEISALKLVKQENKLSLRKLYISLLISLFLILGGIGYVLFRRFRFKKEEEKNEIKKQLEIENLKAQQNAQLAKVKNNLYANISHEFKTPLTLIRVPLQNLIASASDEDTVIYDSILKNTDYLLEMLDELLGVSTMRSGKVDLQLSYFNLAQLLSKIKLNFAALYAEKKIQVEWNFDLNHDYFYGDENRLNIVISNLLKNAYNHSSESGLIKCKVSLRNELVITVSNTGKHINPIDLPHIFKRFYRGIDSDYSGSGIGLAWSKQIVDLHDGVIQVDNSKPKQVTFSVNIPSVENLEQKLTLNLEREDFEEKDNNEDDHSRDNFPHILVVEDNLEMQELLKSILKSEFRLDFAENGIIGEEMGIRLQPDLILSDIMMPEKDGFELLKSIKENFSSSHIPVILLTARTDSESRITGLEQDADDYIGKPFNPIELKIRINNLIKQRKRLHELFVKNPLLYSSDVNCTPIDSDFIDRARNILEKYASDGLFSVNEFCTELASNRTSVNSKIKALTNLSIGEYIKNFRLEKGVKLLVESNASIIDICTDTGFNNPQVFNKAFKKKFQCTPSAFRQKNRNKT